MFAEALNRHPKIKRLFFKSRSTPIRDKASSWLSAVLDDDDLKCVELMEQNVILLDRLIVSG